MEHIEYFEEIKKVLDMLKTDESPNYYKTKIEEISTHIVNNFKKGGMLFVCGNGGSAADAQHLVGEMIGSYLDKKRKAFPAIALTANTSNLTAIANDFDYSEVFSRQLQAFDNMDYILLGISTSGEAKNVNKALEYAKSKGKMAIGLTGKNGTSLEKLTNFCIKVPSDFTPIIQTAHNAIYHRICELVEKEMTQ